jgi:membrane protease YdiL (CAAX protease family)
MAARPVRYPSIPGGLLLMAMAITGGIALMVPVLAWSVIAGRPFELSPWLMAAMNVLTLGAVSAYGAWRTRAPLGEVFPLRPISLALLPPLVVALAGGAVIVSELDNLLRTVLPLPPELAWMVSSLVASRDTPLASAVLLILVAPLTEETFFRGLLLGGFLTRYRPWLAIAASSALFGAMHLNPWQFLSAALFGLLAGWLFLRTRSLTPCYLAHGLLNSAPLVSGLLPYEIPGFNSDPLGPVVFQPWWLDAAGVVLLTAGLAGMRRVLRRWSGGPA